jgi:acetyl esterase/lipase
VNILGFKKFIRVVILLFSYTVLISGIILGLIVVTGGFAGLSIILDMFLPQFTLVAFIYIIVMVLVVRLKWGQRGQKKWLVFTLFLGLIAFGLNIVPLFGVQGAIGSAESQFNATYGTNWNELIPNELEAKFRAAPFDMGEYINGIPSSSCNVSYDIEYAFVNGNDSLRFDVYLPLTGIGPFPTIITIHGGGWTSGNKGTSNLAYVNRYLASQGYAVFDIIYGLAKAGLAGAEAIGIDKLTGSGSVNYNNSYTIPQMVKNIGTFTHYLAAHAQEYKVNLSQVFVLGRSAGAHLAGCVVLGFDDSPYSSVFNHSITIRGGILYYPPCNMTAMFYNSLQIAAPYRSFIDVQEMFDYLMESNATNYGTYSPRSYVKANSPPLLIFHGSNDKLVPTDESRDLKAALESVGNTDCILIEMPFMGHAFDMIPGNPYSQITYYYLERFLALTLITT